MQEFKQELPVNINALTKTVIPILLKGNEQPIYLKGKDEPVYLKGKVEPVYLKGNEVGSCSTSAVGYTAYGEFRINDEINLEEYQFTYSMVGGNLVAVNLESKVEKT